MIERLLAATITIPPQNIPDVELTNNTVALVLSAVFIFIGGLAMLFLLIGAVRYVTSNGDPGQTTQAKNTILYAVIGIVVSSSAFAIVQFMVGQLSQ
jgi:hypothetical protein